MSPKFDSPSLFRIGGLAACFALGASLAFAQAPQPSDNGPDPALVNLAPGDPAAQSTQAPGQPASPDQQNYMQQTPAPIVRSAPTPPAANTYNAPPASADDPNAPVGDPNASNNPQDDANVVAGEQALADADISADEPPPALPDYDQPPAPADDYLWTPGYWGYAPSGYYWVPGVWIAPPYYGALWTPGYWGWYGGRYRWHPGYWGLHIGFYGGVNYGFGYIGVGYFGGYWNGGHFFYNRAVTNVGGSVTNVYSHTVVYNNHTYGAHPTSFVSYNGGRGGINVAPRPAELAAAHEAHTGPLPGQVRLHQSAAQNPQAAFSANHGNISPNLAARSTPLGANRTIARTQSEFSSRPATQQPQRSTMAPRPQSQQPRAQPQSRPAPQARPAPASHPAPAAHDTKH